MSRGFPGFFRRRHIEDLSDIKEDEAGAPNARVEQLDHYGFRIAVRPRDVEARKKCEEKARRRAERWMPYEMSRKLPRDSRTKALIRKGVPHGLRCWVWMETSEANSIMKHYGADYYKKKLQDARERSAVAKQIELDVPRTFPGHAWLDSLEGQKRLENVLLAYSMHNPSVGYCQSMNYVVALLLLVLDKREDLVFFILIALIERILFEGVYEPNLVGCQIEMKSLGDLLSMKLPKLARHLDSMHCEMSLIATDWFLCLFCTSVPSEVCVRIWDCIFNEGPKIIFRVAVAILTLAEKHLMKIDNAGEMLRAVKLYASNIHNRDKLLKVAFGGIGSLSKTTIGRLREIKKKEVDALLAYRSRHDDRKRPSHQPSRWDTAEQEESVAVDSDGVSSIATAMSGFSIDWKDLPDNDPHFQFGSPPSFTFPQNNGTE